MPKQLLTFDTKVSLAVANSIYRKHGYTRTTEATFGERKSNKERVLEELSKEKPKFNKKDTTLADEIMEHYQGLLLTKLGDKQSDFQEAVLSCVAQDTIKSKQIGVLASLPHTYKCLLERDKRQAREKLLAKRSIFVGEAKKRNIFDVIVDMVKPLPHKGLNIVTFLDKDENIVKYFTPNTPEDDGIVQGAKMQISGYVKGHQVNKYNNGNETIINRIKVLRLIKS